MEDRSTLMIFGRMHVILTGLIELIVGLIEIPELIWRGRVCSGFPATVRRLSRSDLREGKDGRNGVCLPDPYHGNGMGADEGKRRYPSPIPMAI
jgi:hypothetical protein